MADIILQNEDRAIQLDISNKQLENRAAVISDKDLQIQILQKVSAAKDSIIENKEEQLQATKKLMRRENNKKKLTKVAWVSSVAILVVLLVLKK